MQILDLMPGVSRKLGGRADVNTNSPLWIKDAVTELTESYPFEQLAVDGPVVQFQPTVPEYPITFFTNNNEYPSIIRSWFVSTSTNKNLVPTASSNNTTGRFLKYRTLPVLDVMSKVLGVPSKWSRNGKNFLIGSCPDQAYATQIKYQREHPWLCSLFDPIALSKQTVFLPQSWSIIVEFLAAKIGAAELRMLDYAKDYHDTLYGDPNFAKTGQGNPGLIFSRTSNYNRDSSNNERQIQMVVMKQCA